MKNETEGQMIPEKIEEDYLDRIKKNFNEIDRKELKNAYAMIKDADCIIINGSGRSLSALQIGMSQIAKKKRVISPDNFGFPGLEWIHKNYENVILLSASGSGTTASTLDIVSDFIEYLKETRKTSRLNGSEILKNKMCILAITSKSQSKLTESIKDFGKVLIIKGRTKRSDDLTAADRFLGQGIMGDQFELCIMSLLQRICECQDEDMDSDTAVSRIFERADEQFSLIRKNVERIIKSDDYKKVIEKIISPRSVTLGGVAHGDFVASMTAIRLNHVKRALGDEVFMCRGETTPNPRFGDLVILISYSGETPTLISWLHGFKDRKIEARVLAVTAVEDSTLSKESDYGFIIRDVKLFLFSWDDVPGKDNDRLITHLVNDMKMNWAINAKINKSDNGKIITVTEGENLVELKLEIKGDKEILEIVCAKTCGYYEYILKEENGRLNIYIKIQHFQKNQIINL